MCSNFRSFFVINFIFIGLFWISALSFAKDEPKSKGKMIRIYARYNFYRMKEFNAKLEPEKNNLINSGTNIGIEFSPLKIKIPVIGETTIPVGGEYLHAVLETTHTAPEGSATVKWNLPIIGIYVAPLITLSKILQFLYMRPIGIGICSLGKI